MKLDINKVIGGITLALVLFIAGKVWQAVEIAKENQVRIEYLREDVDQLWANTSELAKEVD